eukprot:1254707-Lingulodinium_polyedra.AAC.1
MWYDLTQHRCSSYADASVQRGAARACVHSVVLCTRAGGMRRNDFVFEQASGRQFAFVSRAKP